MRRNDMRVAPLAVLYQHKSDYYHHQKKLEIIKEKRPQRENNELFQKMELVRMNLQQFEKRKHTRSLELTKMNEKIVQKLQNIKSIINFKSTQPPPISYSPLTRISSSKSKSIIQHLENERLKVKVKSMSSELSKKSMLRDYDRSMQIKNRIMRYQTQHNNRVSLKADKVLSVNQNRSKHISARLSQKQKEPLPFLSKNQTKTTAKIQSKNVNVIRNTRKEQIKSKLQMQQRLSKVYRQQQFKTEQKEKQKTNDKSLLLGHRNTHTFCTAVDTNDNTHS